MKLLLTTLTFALIACAQTKIPPGQLTCPGGTPSPAVIVAISNGGAVVLTCIPLDGTTLQIVGGKLTAIVPPAPTVTDVYDEVPAGTIDGTNRVFTLAATPIAGTVRLYFNSGRQKAGVDYTVTGRTITLSFSPRAGDVLFADYRVTP